MQDVFVLFGAFFIWYNDQEKIDWEAAALPTALCSELRVHNEIIFPTL
jgi:hypothetical protein